MTCAQCGAANGPDARFCGECGAATAAAGPAVIGRDIAGRYRLIAKLGEGGMGAVYRAEQISLKRTVAVKLLRPDVVGNQMVLRRFNAEAEAVAKLNHPNTVNIYDFGQDTDGTLFIAMEYIEGRSLRQVIHHEAPLAPRRALAIALQVAASLADAHARAIVHRDLKPDNVMLQDRGRERDIARVLDFGIAKLRDDTRATQPPQLTQQGDMLGTPQYMAPEQIRGEQIDGRTDIYALGCLLYELVTGRLPHEAPTVLAMLSKHLLEQPVPPSQRRPELGLPIGLDLLILGAMAKDPGARPPTMEALGEHIAALHAMQPPDPRSAQRSAVGSAVGSAAFAAPIADTPIARSALAAPGAPASARVPPASQGPALTPVPPGPAGWTGAGTAAPPRALPPPASRRALVIVLAAVLAVGAAVAAVLVRSAGPGTSADPGDRPEREVAAPSGSDPWSEAKAPPAQDHWGAAPAVDGTKVSIGQGVSLIIPPGFQTSSQNGITFAVDARGVSIGAAPIDVATDDPKQLARIYARRNNLVVDSMQTVYIGGVQRAMLIFRGAFRGVAVRQAAVPLIGPGYRLIIAFQAPAQLAKDTSVTGQLFDLYARRIVLP